MQHPLRLHPDSACEAITAIAVEAVRSAPDRLSLHFRAKGPAAEVSIPPPARPVRTDELWRHTCFEAFLRREGAEAYLEINLAPSGQWAAYLFHGYRAGMRPAPLASPPAIRFDATGDALELVAELDLTGLLPPAAPWRLALTAVIEETSGRTSYWALAHPPGRADFHRDDGFALTLPSPA